MLALGFGFFELWELYHKVSFDPVQRVIRVNDGVTSLDIRTDIYSDWKEWSQLKDYTGQAPPAIRTIGGDPTGDNQRAGDLYFLINNWKLVVDVNQVRLTGVLLSDDYETAYWRDPKGQNNRDDLLPLFPARVSSLVTTVEVTPEQDLSNLDFSNANITVQSATAQEIRQEIDANSTQLAAILSDIGVIENKVDQTDNTVNNIETTVISTDNTVDSINTTVGVIDTNVNDIETLVTNVDNQISAVSNDVTEIQSNLMLINNDISTLTNTVNDINANTAASTQQLSNIENTVNSVDANVSVIDDKVDDVQMGIQDIQADIANISFSGGLTPSQATMILEMYELLGLDPTKPLVVTETNRSAGNIDQTIATTSTSTTVSRN